MWGIALSRLSNFCLGEMLCCSVDLNLFLCSGLPAERDGLPVDSHIRSLGDLGGAGENCASCILQPPLNQDPADGPYEQRPVGSSFSNVADGPFIVRFLSLVLSLLTRVFEDGSCLGRTRRMLRRVCMQR
jgi:hypothetical protein